MKPQRHADHVRGREITRPRVTGTVAGAVAVTGLSVLAAAAAAGVVLVGAVARKVVVPARDRPSESRILRLDRDAGTIELVATPDTVVPGRYGSWVAKRAAYVQLGDIIETTEASVVRTLLGGDVDSLRVGQDSEFSGWFFRRPEELGLPHIDVEISTELGPAPAWVVHPEDGPSTKWAVLVHGRGTTRSEALRAVPTFRAAGYSCLLVSYRNDGDAPPTPDFRYSLGDEEWRDVDAAIAFSREQGATDVVLMGWSMGGAIVLQASRRTSHPELIRAVALDSPVIDWVDVLQHQARENRIPGLVGRVALLAISRSWGRLLTGQATSIDLTRLDYVANAADLTLPILLMHSDDDGYVPAGPSRALAKARPDIVTFVPFDVARHTKLWNYDPERWSAAVADWLDGLEGFTTP
ncbi:alpha/beta hydrolase family protein [Plantibacter sp. Mn2098]|uniref:alpha/beta hydrolase family protein n=1 Tax=Plantibacter sp. Mn2098 TaxID=3395266 RepID=UPI003BD0C3A1